MIRRILLVIVLSLAPMLASAGDPRRDAILSEYATEVRRLDPSFAGFSAQQGEQLFRNNWNAGDARTPSCTACHTANPRQPGQNAKTGRPIAPVAASVNPRRFTDKAEVDKHFLRDCKSVLGRECTALEKGDYIAFMACQ